MGEALKVTKSYSVKFEKPEDGKREIVSIISTDSVDRDGEVVLPKGLKKKNFAGNPVVLFNHDLKQLPIGKSLWVKESNGVILAKTYISDKTQLARDVFGLMQDGVLSTMSVGFFALKQSPPTTKELNDRPDWKNARNVIREWDMFEYSVVPVPANQDAITLAVSKGYSAETIKIISGQKKIESEAIDKVVGEVVQKNHFNNRALIKALEKAAANRKSIDIDAVVAAAFHRINGLNG